MDVHLKRHSSRLRPKGQCAGSQVSLAGKYILQSRGFWTRLKEDIHVSSGHSPQGNRTSTQAQAVRVVELSRFHHPAPTWEGEVSAPSHSTI